MTDGRMRRHAPAHAGAQTATPVLRLYPAIDLKEGRVVRLWQGDMDRATVFDEDPAAAARRFAAAGAHRLHVVDLDGAFAGRPANRAAVRAILDAVRLPVQLGGGIRDMATIDGWLEAGVARVVLGTAAVRDPELVRTACRIHPGRILVGIDAREGRVRVAGWAEETEIGVVELARRFADAGVAGIVFTEISRDGTGAGLDIAATVALAEAVPLPVIASGGVGGPQDLRRLVAAARRCRGRIEGVVVGRALHDGRLDPGEAVRLLEGDRPAADEEPGEEGGR